MEPNSRISPQHVRSDVPFNPKLQPPNIMPFPNPNAASVYPAASNQPLLSPNPLQPYSGNSPGAPMPQGYMGPQPSRPYQGVPNARMQPGGQYQRVPQQQRQIKHGDLSPCEMTSTGGYQYYVGTEQQPIIGCVYDLVGNVCGCLRGFLPCACCFLCCVTDPFVVVQQGKQALIYRFGKLIRKQFAGLVQVNPCSQRAELVDVRQLIIGIQKQILLSKDYFVIQVNCSVNLKVLRSQMMQVRLQDIQKSVRDVSMAVIKNSMGVLTFHQIVSKKESLAQDIERQVDNIINRWGIDIDKFFIKSVNLKEAQYQMDLIARPAAQRNAQAKMLNAKGNLQVAGMIKQSSQALSSQSAMQIRWLQGMSKLIKSSTVLFSG